MKASQLESMIFTKKDEPDISSTTRRRMQEVGQKGIVVAEGTELLCRTRGGHKEDFNST